VGRRVSGLESVGSLEPIFFSKCAELEGLRKKKGDDQSVLGRQQEQYEWAAASHLSKASWEKTAQSLSYAMKHGQRFELGPYEGKRDHTRSEGEKKSQSGL